VPIAYLAQSVERLIEDQGVGGSNPSVGTRASLVREKDDRNSDDLDVGCDAGAVPAASTIYHARASKLDAHQSLGNTDTPRYKRRVVVDGGELGSSAERIERYAIRPERLKAQTA
jgi:hypothetical protein